MSTLNTTEVVSKVKTFIPLMTADQHKGQAGRICVIGGCRLYTGAPYFAAISSLRVGADLSYVVCTKDAAPVIKSYSPELMVNPILDDSKCHTLISDMLSRYHALVIGPGLGRDEPLLRASQDIIRTAGREEKAMVIDADAVFAISKNPDIIYENKNCVLTPNIREFRNFMESLNLSPEEEDVITHKDVSKVSELLGHVTIVCKGPTDIISNGKQVLECSVEGSVRRCGGQGDVLAGSMGTFVAWAQQYLPEDENRLLYAAYAACALTRRCSYSAFQKHGRSTLTTDIIPFIHQEFEELFGSKE